MFVRIVRFVTRFYTLVEVFEHVTSCTMNRKSKICTRSGKRSLKAFDTGLMTGDGWAQLTGHGPRDEAPLEMIYAANRFRNSLPLSPSSSCTISLTIITSYGAQIIYQKCSNLHILYTCMYVLSAWVRVTFGMCMWCPSPKCAILITTDNSDGYRSL